MKNYDDGQKKKKKKKKKKNLIPWGDNVTLIQTSGVRNEHL